MDPRTEGAEFVFVKATVESTASQSGLSWYGGYQER